MNGIPPTVAQTLRHPMAWVAAFAAWGILGIRWWAPLMDPDMWWLMWAGQEWLSGGYPVANTFSYTAADEAWILHEPLVALVYGAVGPNWLGPLRCLCLGMLGAVVLRLAWRPGDGWATVLALVPMPIMLLFAMSERAMSWGVLCLAIFMYLVVIRTESWRFAAAAILVGLWANVHGSFFLGIGLLALFNWPWAIAAFLLAMINPHGPALYAFLISYGIGDNVQSQLGHYIVEWSRLDFRDPLQVLGFLWFIGAGVLLLPKGSWKVRLLWLVTTTLVIRAWRNTPVCTVILLPYVARALEGMRPKREIGQPLIAFALIALVVAPFSTSIAVNREIYPTQILEHLSKDERIWNDHIYGGWLGYHGYEVFWDGRNDCYPVEIFEQATRVVYRKPGWERVFGDWKVEAVLTRSQPFVEELLALGWTLTAEIGEAKVVHRN